MQHFYVINDQIGTSPLISSPPLPAGAVPAILVAGGAHDPCDTKCRPEFVVYAQCNQQDAAATIHLFSGRWLFRRVHCFHTRRRGGALATKSKWHLRNLFLRQRCLCLHCMKYKIFLTTRFKKDAKKLSEQDRQAERLSWLPRQTGPGAHLQNRGWHPVPFRLSNQLPFKSVLRRSSPSQRQVPAIACVVPATLEAGNYKVRVTTQFQGSRKLRKEPQSFTFNATFTVV